MSFFGSLVSAVVRTATIPVEIIKDVATMGGACTDEDEPYTVQQTKNVLNDIEDAAKSASKGKWLK